jgi:DNA-binding NarL/FixJ family response regulator
MNQPVRLIIVAANQLFRECLSAALLALGRFSEVESATDTEDALRIIEHHPPDIAVIDLDLRNGSALELIRRVTDNFPSVRVVVIGSVESEAEILQCAEAGASGYTVKQASLEDLLTTVENVSNGESNWSPRMAHALFCRLAELGHQRALEQSYDLGTLSSREFEILELVARGLSNKQIAAQLCVSAHTVKNHVHNILEKLNVERRWQAVEYAYERGWLQRTADRQRAELLGREG